MTILDTPQQISHFRYLALLSMLKLEIGGLRKRGASAYSIIKKEWCMTGNRISVYQQLADLLGKPRLDGYTTNGKPIKGN